MRRALMVVILGIYFCSPMAFAADATKSTVTQGNQGYIYGTAPDPIKPTTTVVVTGRNSNDPGVIQDIIDAVNRIDAWIQRNLW